MPDLQIVNSDRYIEVTHTGHDFQDAIDSYPLEKGLPIFEYSFSDILSRIKRKSKKYENRRGKIDLFCFATTDEIASFLNLFQDSIRENFYKSQFINCIQKSPFNSIFLCEFDIHSASDKYCVDELHSTHKMRLGGKTLHIIERK